MKPRSAPGLLGALVVAAATTTAAPVVAQEDPTWRAWASYEHQLIDSELDHWSDWQLWNAAVERRQGWGSIAGQWLRTRRFGITDDAAVADAYIRLPAGWYMNGRVQLAPDARVLPEQDYRAEVFAALDGWEPSVAYRVFVFDAAGGSAAGPQRLEVLGLGLGRYIPGWYLRARADIVEPFAGDGSTFLSASVRRYLARVDGFVEAVAGAGREVVEVAAGPAIDTRASRAASVRAEIFPGARLGFAAGVGYNWLDALPTRYAATAGLIVRW